jgi:hypothetical protein
VVSGVFVLSFSDQASARTAAREARARGFVVEVNAGAAMGSWQTSNRRSAPSPADELSRYASRLRQIAAANTGVYESFTAD